MATLEIRGHRGERRAVVEATTTINDQTSLDTGLVGGITGWGFGIVTTTAGTAAGAGNPAIATVSANGIVVWTLGNSAGAALTVLNTIGYIFTGAWRR